MSDDTPREFNYGKAVRRPRIQGRAASKGGEDAEHRRELGRI
jgi:hypothetical protein